MESGVAYSRFNHPLNRPLASPLVPQRGGFA